MSVLIDKKQSEICYYTAFDNSYYGYGECGCRAKYMTPPMSLFGGKRMPVCGTHKNVVDRKNKQLGISEKCERINK